MRSVMLYVFGFYLYLFAAGIVFVVLSVWPSSYARVVNLAFALIAAYLVIISALV